MKLTLRALLAFAPLVALAPRAAAQELPFQGLHWREVGPYRGGRSAAVAGIPGQRETYYFGACGGGVWKTTDGGRSWRNVSDGFFGGSIGAVAVSEWDPNVVYVGGGEKTVRGNVSSGEGAWRSTDAGRTWRRIGLEDTRHITRIRIHPRDPDRAWAAALGHLFGPNKERGVFRTSDGGTTWEQVLFVDPNTGCVDLALDPTNPRVLYASFWRVRRTPYSLESGGEGSSIWKTTDGGDTWEEIGRNPGLPRGTTGISGISVSASNPQNVYAIVEAADGGVFRSRDGGATWRATNSERELRQRAWYYSRIQADPADEQVVYVLNVGFHRSSDGGETFERVGTPHGDNHDLWIDPADPRRMIESNDGGANVTFDGGATWSPQDNQPTAQMYRVSIDSAFPYRLLGGQQDNSALRIASRNLDGFAIDESAWSATAGGESGHVVARPDDPDVVYGGSYGGTLVMRNHRTGETRAVHVWPDNPMGAGAQAQRYRFQWNFPILTSPHDPQVLYAAANVLFRTRDGGASWEAISPDLTRDDESKQRSSGGPITQDNTSVEYYGTIFAAAESPVAAGVLWCGSDDGLVHVSRDGGGTWTDVTPPGLPEWAQVNCVEADPRRAGGCFLAATRYKLDDFEPYLFRTDDFGATWRRIDQGIPREHFTRALRADPARDGLLYAGTERGVYASFDGGETWTSLQLDLPLVPVTDLAVAQGDLVAATQGRGYWILDDLSPLHQHDERAHAGRHVLFEPRPTVRAGRGGGFGRGRGGAGTNPPAGVVITYRLGELEADTELRLDVLEEDGTLVRSFTPAATEGGEGRRRGGGDAAAVTLPGLARERGWNRVVWDLDYPGARSFPGMILWSGDLDGPRALPGRYRARLTVGAGTAEVPFEIRPDPRSSATSSDLAAQFECVRGICATLSAAHDAVADIRRRRAALEGLKAGCAELEGAAPLREAIDAALATMRAVEEALYQTRNESSQDPLNFPIRLTDKLAGVKGVVATGAFAPTAQALAVRDELTEAIEAELARWNAVRAGELPRIDELARELAVPIAGGS